MIVSKIITFWLSDYEIEPKGFTMPFIIYCLDMKYLWISNGNIKIGNLFTNNQII